MADQVKDKSKMYAPEGYPGNSKEVNEMVVPIMEAIYAHSDSVMTEAWKHPDHARGCYYPSAPEKLKKIRNMIEELANKLTNHNLKFRVYKLEQEVAGLRQSSLRDRESMYCLFSMFKRHL